MVKNFGGLNFLSLKADGAPICIPFVSELTIIYLTNSVPVLYSYTAHSSVNCGIEDSTLTVDVHHVLLDHAKPFPVLDGMQVIHVVKILTRTEQNSADGLTVAIKSYSKLVVV